MTSFCLAAPRPALIKFLAWPVGDPTAQTVRVKGIFLYSTVGTVLVVVVVSLSSSACVCHDDIEAMRHRGRQRGTRVVRVLIIQSSRRSPLPRSRPSERARGPLRRFLGTRARARTHAHPLPPHSVLRVCLNSSRNLPRPLFFGNYLGWC